MNSNVTTVKPVTQPLVWLVDYSSPLVETESHDARAMPLRDRDGKFAPQEKPLDTPKAVRQAMKKLSKQSQRTSKAIDAMIAMENW